jgi:manganese/zinc/iron transport system permease protein
VGVVLMAAMLITPAAAARYWTSNLKSMIFIAAGLSTAAGIAGAYISWEIERMPTGPWIVMFISLIAIFSFLFSPKKGIVARMILQRRHRLKILEENILKILFQLGEKEKNFLSLRTRQDITGKRPMESLLLNKGLNRLTRDGYVIKENGAWSLTNEGKEKGQRVTRLHRLWELYLTQYLKIAPDHVHEDAESIEHIITPELERKIEEALGFPTTDPHHSEIPNKE